MPTDAGVYLDLRFDFEYSAPCDKCLEITKGFGSEKSGISLMQQREGSFNEEIELGDDDMGIMYVEEDEIDLHEIVQQEVDFLSACSYDLRRRLFGALSAMRRKPECRQM